MFCSVVVVQYVDDTASHGSLILSIQYSIYSVNVVCHEAIGTARVWCCH